ncbi:MAG TPA: hypothetical protein VG759_09205 [Candidatus Angelobacter sp.]|nr:hypothetical protein [Candidatus Angelobacter sp.]
MHLSLTNLITAVSSMCLQLGILIVMMKRRLRGNFPYFFSYTAFCIAQSVVLFASLRLPSQSYTYLYYGLMLVNLLFGFAIMYEVFVNILKPYSAVIDLAKMLFCWAGLFLMLVGVLTASITSGSQPNKVLAAIGILQVSIQLMQCGLLLLLLLFEARLGLSWRTHAMSIGLGLGSFSAIALILCFVQNHLPPAQSALVPLISTISSLAVSAFWGVSLLLPEPQRRNVLDSPARLIFQRWNESLASTPLVAPANQLALAHADSFIPGVEKAVERVLARKMVQ